MNVCNTYVKENDARGSTHIHGHLHGGTSPELLTLVAGHAAIMPTALGALDSQFCAELPLEYHMLAVARAVLRVPKLRDSAAAPLPTELDDARAELLHRGRTVAMNRNLHVHQIGTEKRPGTCKKNANGIEGCRFNMGAPHDIGRTRCLELRINERGANMPEPTRQSIREDRALCAHFFADGSCDYRTTRPPDVGKVASSIDRERRIRGLHFQLVQPERNVASGMLSASYDARGERDTGTLLECELRRRSPPASLTEDVHVSEWLGAASDTPNYAALLLRRCNIAEKVGDGRGGADVEADGPHRHTAEEDPLRCLFGAAAGEMDPGCFVRPRPGAAAMHGLPRPMQSGLQVDDGTAPRVLAKLLETGQPLRELLNRPEMQRIRMRLLEIVARAQVEDIGEAGTDDARERALSQCHELLRRWTDNDMFCANRYPY
eukprot:SAG31_NODE_4832_length_2919_cov_2.417376_2_plen_434_part_00